MRPVIRVCAAFVVLWTLVAVPAVVAGSLPADQPLASFWFPNDLLTWDPATDPDAPFNRSSVPRRDRFLDPNTQVNSHARPDEAGVVILSTSGAGTSNNPSQGALQFRTYAFSHWPYIDIWVMWGGSAGEGLILAPNGGLTDAAHRNGVKMFGNIFFPPNVFGGNIQWVRDLVQRSGATFPVADKLIEVAEYYGFDGWFINQETSGGNAALATDVRDFIRYVRANSSIEIQWYDAMVETGSISYQNAMNANNDAFFHEAGNPVSHSMFLNYFWTTNRLINSATLATSFGRSPYELFAGADIGINGTNTGINWNGLFPEGKAHRMSLGFFATQWSLDTATSTADFYRRERTIWAGPGEDPSSTTSSGWRGVAHFIPARSSINDLPFVTHFNTGQGTQVAIEGEVLRVGDWYNRGLQDLLPTWRWIMNATTTATLEPSLDFDAPYYGGTSLRVTGALDEAHQLDLFKTDLAITADTEMTLVYQTGSAGSPSNLSAALAFRDGGGGLGAFQLFPAGTTSSDGWNTVTFDLSAFAGETLNVVSLQFDAPAPVANYDLRVGRLAIYETPIDVPSPPSSVTVENKVESDPQTATLRLLWDHAPGERYTYNVYRRNPDDTRTYLGGTHSNAYFVAEVERVGSEDETTIEVETVGAEMAASVAATTTFTWDVSSSIFTDGFESGDTTAWSNTTP